MAENVLRRWFENIPPFGKANEAVKRVLEKVKTPEEKEAERIKKEEEARKKKEMEEAKNKKVEDMNSREYREMREKK